MTDHRVAFALVVVLISINGLLSGSEAAFISLREGQLRELERRGGRRDQLVVRLAREPNRFLATIQLGITLAGFLASATAAVTLASPLMVVLGFLGGAAQVVSIAVVTVIVTASTMVIGELAPKRLAMQYARRWALLVASPLKVLSTMAAPVVWLLGTATDVVVRLVGGDPRVKREELTFDELRQLVAGYGELSAEQRRIISGALEIHERSLREVVVPRTTVFRLRADLPVAHARAELADSGHTRAPVVPAGELDDAIGVVHLRDLLGVSGTVAEVARPVLNLPDSLRVTAALNRLLAEHEQFALVIGERSGVAGIVTLEDLLEEMVGEIYDEADEDVRSVKVCPDGSRILPGIFPVHDLADLGVEIGDPPEGDYTTIAGLVLCALGRVPTAPGDHVDVDGFGIDVLGVDRHAITEVRLRPAGA
ncbi:CBS domain-containing protein [Mycolicibacterium chubuense NBB4]|uniref:CBS domain-containing protein n=1 Tax=Mycolicibacterium chubuense (strain NBB4) TaxID=710421 RepID=I4BEY4_MYCCN|nr:hemolysin family protein [Mycolicibacterium chubuense]AFM15841.1 CBS domain-containing protein [Mycolicibacterium chubuense NBB4]